MNNGEVILNVLVPARGGPIAMVGPGDLAQPCGPSLWQRAVAVFRATVDVVREARALETALAANGVHYRSRES